MRPLYHGAMRLRRRKVEAEQPSDTAVLEGDFTESLDELQREIAALSAANRASPQVEAERELVRLRHLAGIRILQNAPSESRFEAPDGSRLPDDDEPIPAISPAELTPGLLRAGILRDGCVLVRELVPRADALQFAEEIDRAYSERDRQGAGAPSTEGWYEEFEAHPPFESPGRAWIQAGGGLLAADSPRLSFGLFEIFDKAGLRELVSGYLGEPALISAHKTTLRKAEPDVAGGWHQDGSFMGPVRALNLWLSLSRCGDEAPGLDIVPRRLDEYVASGTEGAKLSWTISEDQVQEAAGEKSVARPIFEPGDALFFDELFLHKTGSDPSMPNPRFAVENWFFGPSGFSDEYAPIAV